VEARCRDADLSPALHHIDEQPRRATVSSEHEDVDMPGRSALGAQRDRAERPSSRMSGSAAAHTWTRRLVRSLVLLDSWSPASHHVISPQAARRHLRGEWSRSGDLTEAQAAALLALDETTPWEV